MFSDFCGCWEAPGFPKIGKKLNKSRTNQFSNAFSFEAGFWEGSRRVLGRFERILRRFWQDFGNIFKAFWKDFGEQTMIRATKGISMDGWMDGEVLIIGMIVGWSVGVPKSLPSVGNR